MKRSTPWLTLYIWLSFLTLGLFQFSVVAGVAGTEDVEGRAIKKYANVVLYKEKGGSTSVEYWDNRDLFANLEALLKKKLVYPATWMCIKAGVFIFYSQTDYKASNSEEAVVIMGHGRCLASGPLAQMKSARHAGSKLLPISTPHLTMFSQRHYSGLVYTVENNSDRKLQTIVPIQSLIIVGTANWTVVTHGGYAHCLVPFVSPENKAQVCLVPDTTTIFSKTSDRLWKQAVKGCEAGDTNLHFIFVTTCFNYKDGEVYMPAIPSTIEPHKENETKPVDPDQPIFNKPCDDLLEVTNLLRWRLTHDFVSNYQPLLPLDKKHLWRTELLDAAFEVVTTYLPAFVVPPAVLFQVREFFLYFLEKRVWANATASGVAKGPSYETLLVIQETRECMVRLQVDGNKLANREKILKRVFERFTSSKLPEEAINTELRISSKLDPLIEFVWLSMNLVATACHYVKEFETNFWIDFTTLVNDQYLVPMIDQWIHQSKASPLYPIIFGGYDFLRQYDLFAVATTQVFRLVKNMHAFPRPEQVLRAADLSRTAL